MKKLIFIFVLVIPICKAADPYASWYQAVQHIPNWQQEYELFLNNNNIGAIPDNFNPPKLLRLDLSNNNIAAIPDKFNAPNLELLDLGNNNIQEVNPQRLLVQFPKLSYLDLSDNPLDPDNIQDLRDAVHAAGRNINIIANNINPPRPEGQDIKGD